MKKINNLDLSRLFPLYTKQILLIICLFSILSIVQMMKGDEIEAVQTIYRPNFQEDSMKYKLYYQMNSEKIQELELKIRSKEASFKELNSYIKEVNQAFITQFQDHYNHQLSTLDENELFLNQPIDLKTTYKGCEIKYFIDEVIEIDEKGWIDPQFMNQVIQLPYSIKYKNHEQEGELSVYISRDYVTEAYLTNYNKYKLEEAIQMLELDTSSDQIILPQQDDITFYQTYVSIEKSKYFIYIILLIMSLSFLSHYEVRHQKELFEKEKRIQLMYFLNNFILMFHSGLTIQKSFYLSVDNRIQTLEKKQKITPYFLKWKKMIQQEQEFSEIIEDFQKCFSIIEGRRFCRLIMQNLRQGDHHLTIQLATLSEGMWDQRIRIARKESEKASSKLVFPMLIIFIVILLITIMPSFMEVNMM